MKTQLRNLSALVLGLAVAATATAPAQTRSITNNLVVHLTFDQTLIDDSGRANNATYNNASGTNDSIRPTAPTYIDGKLGKAFQFHTAADASVIEFASLGYPDDLKFGTNTDFSVAFWIDDISNTSDSGLISCENWNSSRNVGWGIYAQGSGNFRVVTCNGSGADGIDCCSGAAGGANGVRTTLPNLIRDGAWHHIVVTTQRGGNRIVYLDGVQVNSSPVPNTLGNTVDTDTFVNGLGQPYAINIGQDGTGAYTQSGAPEAYNPPPATPGGADITAAVDDVGIWRRVLSPTEVVAIFNYGELGTNLFNVPDVNGPIVLSFTPNNGSTTVLPNVPITAAIQDQTTQLDTNSVRLLVDGRAVAPTITKAGAVTTVAYSSPYLFAPATKHTNILVFADNATPVPGRTTNVTSYTVATWTNTYLGTPIYFENFDELTPATNPPAVYPTGWTVQDCTDPAGDAGTWSLLDPTSDAYQDWQIVPISVVASYFNYDGRILNVNGPIVLNGAMVSVLGSNNIAFAASDQRSGSQVDYLFTRDYDLSGQSNVWVAFNSIYSQEVWQMGALEYSTDQGATWLPIVYMLDPSTIVVTNGVIDAETTMTTNYFRIPYGTCGYGNSFGAFIGVDPSLYGTLGTNISPRIASDHVTNHKIERYRVARADGQSKVRFRFAMVGANFWDWGFDNFGLYSRPPTPPDLVISNITNLGGNLTINWNGTGANLSGLQWTPSLTAPAWTQIPGTIGQTNYTAAISGAAGYYRAVRY